MMVKEGILPLDSYRLAQYSVQVPCYICTGPNTFDCESCRHCGAPMALTHQANTQKICPKTIAAIGTSGVGKTVYLGMLMDILSRQPGDLQLLARGAFSISLQQNTVAALARCEVPAKTPSEPERWNWVHCQLRSSKHRRPAELIMPDLAGEALIEEVDHPNTFPVIRSLLSKCSGVLLLVDAAKLSDGTHGQDYFTMKLLSYLLELDDDPRNGWRQRPVAVVFTKADVNESCFEDPANFARHHTTGVWQLCHERFNDHGFFATSVAGGCVQRLLPDGTRASVPLRVEPRGVTVPFQWLVQRIWK